MHLNLPSGLILEHRGRHRASTTSRRRRALTSLTPIVAQSQWSVHNLDRSQVKSSQVKGRLWRGVRGFKSSLYINNRQQTTLDLT